MRARTVGCFLSLALLLPNLSNAQSAVTAQSAEWQIRSEPIVVNGLVYYPTRETRFFDREIMTQTGVYLGVPVFADVTLEPHSVVYVPVSTMLLRGYERRRDGELAGTVGSRTSSFPVTIPSEPPPSDDWIATMAADQRTVTTPGAIGTSGSLAAARDVPRPARTRVESIPRPRSNDGIWLEYGGKRWYSDGPAVVFDATRFVAIGDYRGFPVYRDKERGADEIWVRVVAEGPVAPYTVRSGSR